MTRNILRTFFLLAACFGAAAAGTARFYLATNLLASDISSAFRTDLINAAAQAAGVPTNQVQLAVGPYLRLTVNGVSNAAAAEAAIRARLNRETALLRLVGVDCTEALLAGTALGGTTLPKYDTSLTGNELGVLRAMRNTTKLLSFDLARDHLTLDQAITSFLAALVLEADTVLYSVNDCVPCLTYSVTPTPSATPSATRTRQRPLTPPEGGEPVSPRPRPVLSPEEFPTPVEPSPVPVSPPEGSDEGLSGGAIAGIVIGAVILALLILAGLLWWLCAPVAAAPVAVVKAAPLFAPVSVPVTAVPEYAMQTQIIDEFFNVQPEFAMQEEVIDEVEEVWGAQQFAHYPGFEAATAQAPAFFSHDAPLMTTPVSTGPAGWFSH